MSDTPPSSRHAPGPRALFRAPARAVALSEWALVPLRLFLGATFTYAGLQKLANPNFFNGVSPISIHAQLVAAARVSPLRGLVVHLEGLATPIGATVAVVEVAVGVATLIGLWQRVAALGGALLSLLFFLTVSFHAAPYYTGADLVFLAAWLPLALAGRSSRLSLHGVLDARVAAEAHRPTPEVVAIAFDDVRALCGHFDAGCCAALDGDACDSSRCPVLVARAPSGDGDAVERRAVVLATASTVLVGGAVAVGATVAAVAGRVVGGAPAPVNPNALHAPPGATPTALGVVLGRARDVPVGTAASFTIPVTGDPGIVIQPSAGVFDAYDAVCPHAGCTVGYYAQNHVFACPCHGSQFLLANGEVISGPAPHGLAKLTVVEGPNGNLYLK